MSQNQIHRDKYIQDFEFLFEKMVETFRLWWSSCQNVIYHFFLEFLTSYANEWLTPQASHHLSFGISWAITAIIFYKAGTMLVKFSGEILKWAIDLVFIKSIIFIKTAIKGFFSQVMKTIVYLVNYIPRSIWQAIIGKK